MFDQTSLNLINKSFSFIVIVEMFLSGDQIPILIGIAIAIILFEILFSFWF